MMDADTLTHKLWAASTLVSYWTGKIEDCLLAAGVRDSHDAEGDRLGDSPEASMVRVHARAALGAMKHLAASLDTLADLIDPDAGED